MGRRTLKIGTKQGWNNYSGAAGSFFNNSSVSSEFLEFFTKLKSLKDSLRNSLTNPLRNLSSHFNNRKNAEEVLVHSLKWGQSSSNLFFTWMVYCALNFCASQHCKTAMQQLIRANLYGKCMGNSSKICKEFSKFLPQKVIKMAKQLQSHQENFWPNKLPNSLRYSFSFLELN